eukprot:7054505-Prorocentrum_lima.AAC.1
MPWRATFHIRVFNASGRCASLKRHTGTYASPDTLFSDDNLTHIDRGDAGVAAGEAGHHQ